jgi:hypothetical protein
VKPREEALARRIARHREDVRERRRRGYR